MGELLTRRREMAQAVGGGSQWDAEWDFTMGYPDDNGWEKHFLDSKSYASTATLTSVGLKLWARVSSTAPKKAYAEYYNPTDFNNITGVLETKMRVKRRGSNANGYAEVCFGNGTNGIKLLFMCQSTYKGRLILPTDADAYGGTGGTNLAGFSSDKWYKVRLVLDNGVGAIYRNDTLLIGDVDVSTLVTTENTIFGVNGFSDSVNYHYAEFEYVKLKLGRTS